METQPTTHDGQIAMRVIEYLSRKYSDKNSEEYKALLKTHELIIENEQLFKEDLTK